MKIRGIVPSILGHSVAFPDGTSSAPSIAFSTDPGMGLWLDTTNDLIGSSGLSVLGRILQTALATPGSITVTPVGTTGATTYTYVLVALSGAGVTPAGAASSTATGNATLSSTNYNQNTWVQVAGATGYRLYRTVGGATQGLIATIARGDTLTVNDTGLAGGGETAPTADTTGQFLLPSAGSLVWGSDLFLVRDAANTLAQRNGASAQTFRVYQQWTDASNYVRASLAAVGDQVTLASETAGTGADNINLIISAGGTANLDLATNGLSRWRVDGNGHLLVVADSAYDIGASGATRPRTGYFGTSLEVQAGNGQALGIKRLTELTTIAAAATTDTAIQIPANAVVFAVSVRVTTVIPTAATFTVIGTTSSTAFQTGASVSTAANTTDVGTKACPYLNTTAQTVRITPNLTPADNTGRVRVTIHYYDITPPTS